MFDKQIEDFSREYATLTDAERSYVIYEVVGKALYKEYPVDIDTFIFDPYFLGNIYGDIIFPMWVDVLKEIYPAPFCKRYNEVLLSCATRSGKTTVAVISALYELYMLLCMISPSKTLNIKCGVLNTIEGLTDKTSSDDYLTLMAYNYLQIMEALC